MLKLLRREPRSDLSLEEMADALGVSPEYLKRVAEEFARQIREGYECTSVPASEALAAFQRS